MCAALWGCSARAEMRLAEEYDAAQERGEVAGPETGRPKSVGGDNAYSAADLGLRRDEIHEACKLPIWATLI
ncbi:MULTISPECIES: hypothetical protein [unclassified Paracoccus (in: a-proteobacteria)]|uniref:hypothetical protein n=1 Tax=unclassified Paracoccus (in: a-proteobacteria) TaxID=2688777 RepID=UPI0002F55A07|nr:MULTISPECIES: hypothetical protein [unclassified Paracoccus (in: a-proteobacteria)]SMG36625.1 hypothetical protein SAMN02746000_02198 [Paracoccus sp. J56]